jgi:mannosyltransferase OCH1-like enzyme
MSSNIPKTIFMCDKTLFTISKYSINWKKKNPGYQIKLYNDRMCEEFLLHEYSKTHKKLFRVISDGPIKADFWRVCVLYKYGGVYIDADNEPLVPLRYFINPNADFVTCSSYMEKMNYNPNFIMSKAGNPTLKKCIDMYIDFYTSNRKYSYWDWSIMNVMTLCLELPNYKKQDGIYELNGKTIQIIKECPGKNHSDAHNIFRGLRVFNNRYANWDSINHCFV